MDLHTIATLAFNMGWMHRTIGGVFPGNTGTIVTSLENVLAVPLQWSITAWQFANYTMAPGSGLFAMPEEMLTVARGGRYVQRLVIQTWTGWTFIAVHAFILFFVLGNIVWIMRTEGVRDGVPDVPELDTLAMAKQMRCYKKSRELDGQDFEQRKLLGELADDVKDKSSWTAAGEMKGWWVEVDRDARA